MTALPLIAGIEIKSVLYIQHGKYIINTGLINIKTKANFRLYPYQMINTGVNKNEIDACMNLYILLRNLTPTLI